jgi:tetratricopeptide (TPR) repeat protein
MQREYIAMHHLKLAVLGMLLLPFTTRDVFAQVDPIETKRRDNYVERLEKLQNHRTQLQERATALAAQSPAMQEAVAQAMQRAMVAEGMLAQSQKSLSVSGLFFNSGGLMQGRSSFVEQQPNLIVWYVLEDNTRWRSALVAELANSQAAAAINIANLQSTMISMKQIAAEADKNFLEFRKEADLMGRRGKLEVSGAETFTAQWLLKEPLNAGVALIQAYALRADGKLTESEQLLDKLDDNYPQMQAIHETLAAQNAFIRSNPSDMEKHLDKALGLVKVVRIGEPYLIAGWIHFAQGDLEKAQRFARQLRMVDNSNIESVILESLVMAKHMPRKAKDALELLQSAQQPVTKDDWHYHEALGLVHAAVGNRNNALREVNAALDTAPTFVRPALKKHLVAIQADMVPDVDWSKRLRESWQL